MTKLRNRQSSKITISSTGKKRETSSDRIEFDRKWFLIDTHDICFYWSRELSYSCTLHNRLPAEVIDKIVVLVKNCLWFWQQETENGQKLCTPRYYIQVGAGYTGKSVYYTIKEFQKNSQTYFLAPFGNKTNAKVKLIKKLKLYKNARTCYYMIS